MKDNSTSHASFDYDEKIRGTLPFYDEFSAKLLMLFVIGARAVLAGLTWGAQRAEWRKQPLNVLI